MFSKYWKFIKGEEKGGADSPPEREEPVPPPPAAQAEVPVPERSLREDGKIVDTGHGLDEEVRTSILAVETHGSRVSAEELRNRFLSRRPMLDKAQQIVGYELRLRQRDARPPKEPGDALWRMRDDMLLRGFLALKPQRLTADKLVFLSVSPVVLDNMLLNYLPKEGVVLALPAENGVGEWVGRLKELADQGYVFALDDPKEEPALAEALRVASFVRMDISRWDALTLGERMAALEKRGPIKFIARNVDGEEGFEACRQLAFHLFEGYYFTKPLLAQVPHVDSDRERVIELLNMVTNHAEISQLEEVFKRDAALSYKLLRYINSPGCGLVQKIRSIAHAIVILGHDQLYRWLTLLLFTSGKLDPRSQALLKTAMVRARLGEVLSAKLLLPGESEGVFIAGIFSLLDALLRVPLAQAIGRLNLPEPVLEALLSRQGRYAPFLELAIACEQGDQDLMEEYAAVCNLQAEEVSRAHMEAMVWAEEVDK